MTTLARDSSSLFDFRGREEDLFCMRRLGVSWRTLEVYRRRIENLDWDASCT